MEIRRTLRGRQLHVCAAGSLVVLAVVLSPSAEGQSLDDLFAPPAEIVQPISNQVTSPTMPEANESEPGIASLGPAVDEIGSAPKSPSKIRLEKSRGSYESPVRPTAMEIRQQRALMQSRSRIARIEAARWSGTHVLRPTWNPNPYSALRSPIRHTITVPVYYGFRR